MRGGGYNVAGRSMCDGGVALDFSLMKDVFLQYPLAHRAPLRQRRHASWGAPSLTITRREALTRLAVLCWRLALQ